MPTNCSAAKQLPQFCKHSKSADLLRKSLLSHVWRVPSSKALSCKHERLFDPGIIVLRLKDALRIVPYFVLPQSCPIFAYHGACAPLLCSYRGGSLSHKTTPVQAHRGFRLLTLASYNVLSSYMINECFDFFFVFYTVCLNGTAHIDRPRMTLSNTFCNVFCIQSAG